MKRRTVNISTHIRERYISISHGVQAKFIYGTFVLLMWKNYLLHIRHPYLFATVMLLPTLVFLSLGTFSLIADDLKQYPNVTFPAMDCLFPLKGFFIVHSPNTNVQINDIMAKMRSYCQDCIFKSFPNGLEMEKGLFFLNVTNMVGIEFINTQKNILPDNLEISIRFPSDLKYPSMSDGIEYWNTQKMHRSNHLGLFYPGMLSVDHIASPDYLKEGFITIQTFIFLSFLRIKTGVELNRQLQIQKFSYQNILIDKLLLERGYIIRRVFFMSFLIAIIIESVPFVKERYKHQHRYFKMMGTSSRLNTFSWYATMMIIFIVVIFFIVLFQNVGFLVGDRFRSITAHSDPTLIFTFYLLYISSFVLLNMIIASMVNTCFTMVTICALVHYLNYDPFFKQATISDDTRWNFCLWHVVCHKLYKSGFQFILNKEFSHEGAQWSNIFQEQTSPFLCMGRILIALACNNLLYFIILMLLDRPLYRNGSWSLKGHRLFCNIFQNKVGPEPSSNQFFSHTYEHHVNDVNPGKITIRNLHGYKTWQKSRLNGINLKIFANEVIAIYGPPCAGKASLLHMICGADPSKSGTIDITSKTKSKRNHFGICSRIYILYDEFTIKEHLILFNSLHAKDKMVYQYQMDFFLNIIFHDSKDIMKLVSDVSFDSKKKLCACLAFCGHPDIVLLDEPTKFVSEYSRRLIWMLIETAKLDKTIIFTTQNMDEAEFLADRICILNHGNQVAFGSPFFLKRITGATYYLTLEKDIGLDVNFLTVLIQSYIPLSRIFYNLDFRVEYIMDNVDNTVLIQMMHLLETNIKQLRIKRISLKYLTLEEIFIRVADGLGEVIQADKPNIPMYRPSIIPKDTKRVTKKNKLSNLNLPETFVSIKGHKLRLYQWKAVFLSVILIKVRSYFIFLMHLLFSVGPLLILNMYEETAKPTLNLEAITFPKSYYQAFTVLLEDSKDPFFKDAKIYLQNYKYLLVDNIQRFIYNESLTTIFGTVFGIKIDGNNLVGMYNQKFFHTDAQVIIEIFNILLFRTGFSVNVTNSPLPRTLHSKINQVDKVPVNLAYSHGVTLSLALSTGLILTWFISERVNRTDHLIRFYGASIFNAWLINKGAALLLYILHNLIIVVVGSYFSPRNTYESLVENTLLVLSFGLFMTSAMHILSYFIKRPSTGFNIIVLSAFIALCIHFTFDEFCQNTCIITWIFEWIFFLIPMLSMCNAFDRMNKWYLLHSQCTTTLSHCKNLYDTEENCQTLFCKADPICCRQYFPNLNFENLSILYILLTNVILAIIVTIFSLALDYKIFAKLKYTFKTSKVDNTEFKDMDEDVLKEARNVHNIFSSNWTEHLIIVRNLRLKYQKPMKVHSISFAIKPGECFTILGTYNSGKSMIWDTLIGNRNIVSGDVAINGFNLKYDRRNIFELVGYNPDPNSLPKLLKVKELIYVLTSLRGIQNKMAYYFLEVMCKELEIEDTMNMLIKNLDCGQLQAVTVMIAFIGNPKLLILDCPTRGMDIKRKIKVWMVLQRHLRYGKGILLTTSSLQECEAMGTKIGVLFNGSFKLLGTMKQLQEINSHSIQVILKVPQGDEYYKHVDNFMSKYFYTVLKEHQLEKLAYQISESTISHWTTILSVLEYGRTRFVIKDYVIGRSNFEQLFILFSQMQRGD